MKPDVVVDIGNTRMKWGFCVGDRVTNVARLPLDDEAAWNKDLAKLPAPSPARKWAAASVNPPALKRFLTWSRKHGQTAVVFENRANVPIRVNVDEPDRVGIDRLFGAVAAKAMVPPNTPAITVDLGTALTVNLIDADGVFQGGAILPGPRLMARALHDFTAKLPMSEPTSGADFKAPAKNTGAAIRLGIIAALNGGMAKLTRAFANECATPPWMFVTGGGAHLIDSSNLPWIAETKFVPALILEGIRIAAEALS